MTAVGFHKIVGSLPATLQANSLYYVRVGSGIDLYVTNSSGTITAYAPNVPSHSHEISDVTGLGTALDSKLSAQDPAITGGTIDGTPIGSNTPASGSFTKLTSNQGIYINSHDNEYGRHRVAGFRRNWDGRTSLGVFNSDAGPSAATEVNQVTGTAYSSATWTLVDNSGNPFVQHNNGLAVQFERWAWNGSGVVMELQPDRVNAYKDINGFGERIWAQGKGGKGVLAAGVQGTRSGFLELYGSATNEGGEINLFYSADFANVGSSNRATIDAYREFVRFFQTGGTGGHIWWHPATSRLGLGGMPDSKKLTLTGSGATLEIGYRLKTTSEGPHYADRVLHPAGHLQDYVDGMLIADYSAAGLNVSALKVQDKPLPFTKEYDSGEQVITVNSVLTLPHGLGVIPKTAALELVCKVSEWDYQVEDVVPFAWGVQATANGVENSPLGFGVRMDSTKIYLKIGAAIVLMGYFLPRGETITPANWRLRVRGFA